MCIFVYRMTKKESFFEKIKRKLLSRYRMIIINEVTFEEQLFFRISRLNVIIFASLVFGSIMALAFIMFSLTPLKEFIPGKASTELNKTAIENRYTLDSITTLYEQQSRYLSRIQQVLTGNLAFAALDSLALEDNKPIQQVTEIKPNAADSLLREMVAQEDKYNPVELSSERTQVLLFPPAQGPISEEYNPQQKHYAVDIVLEEDSPIKSIADGTVIFAEWTTETGYVIMVEHPYGLLSVYKHNNSLTRTQGDAVKAGEIIATAGNTGELSTGWHLHFELWVDGYPMNPTQFIDFGNASKIATTPKQP